MVKSHEETIKKHEETIEIHESTIRNHENRIDSLMRSFEIENKISFERCYQMRRQWI
jgi:hypothetical protein